MDIYVKFWHFLAIYFLLILHLTLEKAAKFLAEKLSTSKVISQKPYGGMENNPPPLPSAFRVKNG